MTLNFEFLSSDLNLDQDWTLDLDQDLDLDQGLDLELDNRRSFRYGGKRALLFK